MSNDTPNLNDPLAFVRSMWSGMGISMPGMVTPTFDVDELDKRIKDMKAVECRLRKNLSMFQMTIQALEMQRTTLDAVQTMGKMASESARSMTTEATPASAAPEAAVPPSAVDPERNAFSGAAMWPWQMMQQMRDHMQQAAEASAQAASAEKPAATKPADQDRKSP